MRCTLHGTSIVFPVASPGEAAPKRQKPHGSLPAKKHHEAALNFATALSTVTGKQPVKLAVLLEYRGHSTEVRAARSRHLINILGQ
jgi:hypothetical protein